MSLLTGILAYYKLDENTGTTTADATGNGNTGALSGSTLPAWTTGKINFGLSFSGSSGGAHVDLGSAILPAAVTFAAWVNFSSFASPESYVCVVGKDTAANGNSYCVLLVKSTGKLAPYLFATANVDYDGTGSNTLTTGTWYHLAMTYDSVSGLVGYVNGAADGTAAANGAINNSTAAPTQIGGENNHTGRYTTGTIDEVGIWSRALTSTEISQLYNSGSGLQYPFSGGATSSLFRQNNLTGIGSGGPFFQNPLTRSMLGWRKKLSGLLVPDPVFA